MSWLGRGIVPGVRLLLHDWVIGHVLKDIVGEEELSVRWDHDDLDLVGQSLGDDLVDEQRILLEEHGFDFVSEVRRGIRLVRGTSSSGR